MMTRKTDTISISNNRYQMIVRYKKCGNNNIILRIRFCTRNNYLNFFFFRNIKYIPSYNFDCNKKSVAEMYTGRNIENE